MRLCRKNVLIGQRGLHLELWERGLMLQASLGVGKVEASPAFCLRTVLKDGVDMVEL